MKRESFETSNQRKHHNNWQQQDDVCASNLNLLQASHCVPLLPTAIPPHPPPSHHPQRSIPSIPDVSNQTAAQQPRPGSKPYTTAVPRAVPDGLGQACSRQRPGKHAPGVLHGAAREALAGVGESGDFKYGDEQPCGPWVCLSG